jgi:hypothetical protein
LHLLGHLKLSEDAVVPALKVAMGVGQGGVPVCAQSLEARVQGLGRHIRGRVSEHDQREVSDPPPQEAFGLRAGAGELGGVGHHDRRAWAAG